MFTKIITFILMILSLGTYHPSSQPTTSPTPVATVYPGIGASTTAASTITATSSGSSAPAPIKIPIATTYPSIIIKTNSNTSATLDYPTPGPIKNIPPNQTPSPTPKK